MTNIDQFESVFKAADKPRFRPEKVEFRSALVVTTLDQERGRKFESCVQSFLSGSAEDFTTRLVVDEDFTEVRQLLALVEDTQPDLICTYRNLKRPATDYPYSLGVFVDVMTQATKVPVLLLPILDILESGQCRFGERERVLAITDHLTGDHHLVSVAAQLTQPNGTLLLAHIEDKATFNRYVETISKIPTIDTSEAHDKLLDRLLKDPHDYIQSCREVLSKDAAHLQLEEIIRLGHRLMDYKTLVQENQIDLLVMNTKDEDQLAMHGVAYPLAIELRETPLLLL